MLRLSFGIITSVCTLSVISFHKKMAGFYTVFGLLIGFGYKRAPFNSFKLCTLKMQQLFLRKTNYYRAGI
jgi:hypothetical protein